MKNRQYYTGEISVLIQNIFDRYNIRTMADLGSGTAPILFALFEKGFLDNIAKIIAVDISKESIEIAQRISNKITCIRADVCKLDMLENESLDLIISNQVIEHLIDEDKFIKEVYRILSKDGIFYFSTVFKKGYAWYFYRCNGKWALDPTHFREYTDDRQLLDIIERNQFQVLENKKTMHWFPLSDFILKRIGLGVDVYHNKFLRSLRFFKIPILGYYNWELVVKKKAA